MRFRFRSLLSLAVLLLLARAASSAETPATVAQPRTEVALGYTYLRSNAPPGRCGCFNLNGGSASFAWSLNRSLALAGDVTVDRAGAISSSGLDLTLSTYTAGLRYRPRFGHTAAGAARLQPFAQVLAGVAHSSGTLVQGQVSNSGAAFAANLGGGLDLKASRLFSIRLLEADYLVTRFDNGVNDHQNILRIGAGVVLHF
jgi:hypothetical protein